MTKHVPALVAASAAVLLAGCSGLHPGPVGRVVAKDTVTTYLHVSSKTGGTNVPIFTYYLTTKDPADGSTARFEVPSEAYDRCYRGSSYPHCTTVDR